MARGTLLYSLVVYTTPNVFSIVWVESSRPSLCMYTHIWFLFLCIEYGQERAPEWSPCLILSSYVMLQLERGLLANIIGTGMIARRYEYFPYQLSPSLSLSLSLSRFVPLCSLAISLRLFSLFYRLIISLPHLFM